MDRAPQKVALPYKFTFVIAAERGKSASFFISFYPGFSWKPCVQDAETSFTSFLPVALMELRRL